MLPLKQPCIVCGGKGIVPHQKRLMANGEPDPADFRVYEVCTTCGGGGMVQVDKTQIAERAPGFIADNLGETDAR